MHALLQLRCPVSPRRLFSQPRWGVCCVPFDRIPIHFPASDSFFNQNNFSSDPCPTPTTTVPFAMEAAGLILGGFSLVISAMEHYATMEKMSRTWWKMRREHRKDLGRLRDCELMYRANMRTLLAPLELNGTIDSSQLELLFTNLDSSGWQEREVDLAISKRLGERKERYFDNLHEMSETMVKLGKVSRALDKEFQATLERDVQVRRTQIHE